MTTKLSAKQAVFFFPDRTWVECSLVALLERFDQFHEVPWTAQQILRDMPGKWEYSLVALSMKRSSDGMRSGAVAPATHATDILAFSFNSVRENCLYVHAFFVAPEIRREGFGRELLAYLSARAATQGFVRIALRADIENPRALAWWLRQGFEIDGCDGERGPIRLSVPVRKLV